jgi:hypothetical protein
MTPQQRKQLRLWIEEEYALLKAEETELPEHEPDVSFLFLHEKLVERLVEKHEIYDDVRKVIITWWFATASPDALRECAAYHRRVASRLDNSDEDRAKIINNAIGIEAMAERRESAPPANPNN